MATLYTKTNPPTAHQSERAPAGAPSYRLVHDGTKVLSLHKSTGVTSTINNMVVGTLDEVNAEIAALKLIPLPDKPLSIKRAAKPVVSKSAPPAVK